MATSFLCALATDRVFLVPAGSCFYANPALCPSRSYDCYFDRLSTCAVTREAMAVASKRAINSTHRVFFGNQNKCRRSYLARLQTTLGVPKALGIPWLAKEALRFIFRPNARLTDRIRHLRAQLRIDQPFVGVHLRSGTNFNSQWNKDYAVMRTAGQAAPPQTYAAVAVEAASRLRARAVFVSVDNFRLLPRFTPTIAAANLTLYFVPKEEFATGTATVRRVDQWLAARYREGGGDVPDEGLTLLANFALLSEAVLLVGLKHSNVFRMLRKLMWTRDAPPCTYCMDC